MKCFDQSKLIYTVLWINQFIRKEQLSKNTSREKLFTKNPKKSYKFLRQLSPKPLDTNAKIVIFFFLQKNLIHEIIHKQILTKNDLGTSRPFIKVHSKKIAAYRGFQVSWTLHPNWARVALPKKKKKRRKINLGVKRRFFKKCIEEFFCLNLMLSTCI